MPVAARRDGERASGIESRAGGTQTEHVVPGLRRVYLVGFMAAGKTAVGSALARLLGYDFHDLDRLIEQRAGAKVHEVFERHGESWFRDCEHDCLRRTEALNRVVIATGGGTMTFRRNRELIASLGASVWLDAPLETIFSRLERGGDSDRPLFCDREQARTLYHSRLDAYRMADLRVETASRETAGDVAARIAVDLRERNCAI